MLIVNCLKFQLGHLHKSRETEFVDQPEDLEDAHEAQVHLSRAQEKQAHVDHLHKLALSLGVDIISSVQRPVSNLEHHHSYVIKVESWGVISKKSARLSTIC